MLFYTDDIAWLPLSNSLIECQFYLYIWLSAIDQEDHLSLAVDSGLW